MSHNCSIKYQIIWVGTRIWFPQTFSSKLTPNSCNNANENKQVLLLFVNNNAVCTSIILTKSVMEMLCCKFVWSVPLRLRQYSFLASVGGAKRAKIQVATGWYSWQFPLDPGDFRDLPWYNYCLYPNRFVNLAAARSQIYNPGLCKKYPWDFEFSARFSRVRANVDWAAKMLLNPFKFSRLEGISPIKMALSQAAIMKNSNYRFLHFGSVHIENLIYYDRLFY